MDAPKVKKLIGELASTLIENRMHIGLGTGSTAEALIAALGERLRVKDLQISAVCSSRRSEEAANRAGIPIAAFDSRPLDLYLDGADEIDAQGNLIKGGGAALLREKLVASSAKRRIILVDQSKLVARLGERFKLPVEIVKFGHLATENRVRALGCETQLRIAGNEPVVTDENHYILDCSFDPAILEPHRTAQEIKSLVGVVESGLFLDCCDAVVFGTNEGARYFNLQEWRTIFPSLLNSAQTESFCR